MKSIKRNTKKTSKMQKERDDSYLRDILKRKLDWAIKEKQKGIDIIIKNKSQILRLDGIILLINDVLNIKRG